MDIKKKKKPRQWKTTAREKTYIEKNEIEISDKESRCQILLKEVLRMPELDLHLHAHQPSGFPKGMELACQVPAGTALSGPLQGCSHQSAGQAPACLRGTAELQLEQAQRRAKGSES